MFIFETDNSGENQDKNKKNNNLVEIKLFVFIYLEFFPKNSGLGGGFVIYFIWCIFCSIHKTPSVLQVVNCVWALEVSEAKSPVL